MTTLINLHFLNIIFAVVLKKEEKTQGVLKDGLSANSLFEIIEEQSYSNQCDNLIVDKNIVIKFFL